MPNVQACLLKAVIWDRVFARYFVIIATICLTTTFAWSQNAPSSDADARATSDLLFKRMLVKPDDLDASFEYAQIETRLGDYEAAIGALERMLYYNPNLPRVKLELGALYFKLKSYQLARTYFNAVLEFKDLPADVRDEVTTYLAAVDRALAINQFSVFGQSGLRYQSNANAGPTNPMVLALGQSALLSSKFQAIPDWNAFALLTAHYFYDFGDQHGDGWESDFVSYRSQQFRVSDLDLGLVELQTGPRLGLGDYGGVSVHPYGIANAMSLGPANYLDSVGAGLSLHVPVTPGLTLTPGVEYRERVFNNSADYPNASGQNGSQWIIYDLATGSLAGNLSWQARLAYTSAAAIYDPYAYRDTSLDISLPYGFDPPALAHSGSLWYVTPSAGFSRTIYDEPDPVVDPNTTRRDTQWRVGASLDTTFYHNLGFSVQIQYLATKSTVTNFRNCDFIVSLGPTVHF
jgi:hypothetical protein